MALVWKATKSTPGIRAGREIRDDVWSSIPPKDRIEDILARFICAALLSAGPQKVTASDAVPVEVTHIRQTSASQTDPRLKDYAFHFHQQTFISVFRERIASLHSRHIPHLGMGPVRSYSTQL